MELLAAFRFYCSHNCFEVFDSAAEPWNGKSEMDGLRPDERSVRLDRGWYKKEYSIIFRTLEQSYNNKISVLRAPSHEIPPDVDRVLAFNISLPSAKLTIFGLDYGETVEIGIGDHALYCRAYNLGVEHPYDDPSLDDDEEFLKRNDLERFELVLVPGKTGVEGLIHGRKSLDPRTE